MSIEKWTAVDQYICELLIPPDPVLDAVLEVSKSEGLPPINVAPNQGKLLHLLALIHGAKTILEIGTLGGYSTIWLARALPADGHLTTLELDPKHAEVAKLNLERAGLAPLVTVRVGPALDSLSAMASEGMGPFDLVFIDADKPSNADYFEWAMKLTRPGSVIIIDNVVRNGAVVDSNSSDPAVLGTRRLNEVLARERRASVTEVQTVGMKGYDGFAIALVLSD